jgi:hypothetical protein
VHGTGPVCLESLFESQFTKGPYISVTSGKRGFYPPPLVPKLFGPGLKVALVPVRAAGT